MAVLDVVKYPDPRLREPTVAVEQFDDGLRELVRDLADTMFAQNGAGIAAIQVGRFERVFLIDGRVAGREDDEPVAFVNPELVEGGRGISISEEGCLSFPGVFVEVKRPRWVKFRAQDVHGEWFEIEGEGLLARALQHELDHLTGRLLVDMVGLVKKEMIKRKMKRWHSQNDGDGDGDAVVDEGAPVGA
ncbi:MAG: peptide deformylase [Deltaproteobacteria bacterium]|nr:peptide deformylase [Deltaproteobacteria bacterium]MBK8716877.1 peptide deformylase [Deltaproteobacteria bacterium]MBP7286983.1 peptide deformylase [Nannocystaceae bacterium]